MNVCVYNIRVHVPRYMFVCIHAIGLYVYMPCIQQIVGKCDGLKHFILEND